MSDYDTDSEAESNSTGFKGRLTIIGIQVDRSCLEVDDIPIRTAIKQVLETENEAPDALEIDSRFAVAVYSCQDTSSTEILIISLKDYKSRKIVSSSSH